jgi:glyoxylase I family protein
MILGLSNLMIFVPELDRARGFYRDTLGLAVESETDRRIAFRVGDLTLDAYVCEKPGQAGDYANEARSVFVFRVGSIDAAVKELKAKGVVFLHTTPARSDGGRYAAFLDPFGNVHEIFEPDGL